MPDEITLTANEAERAFHERDKFFVAVVAGLEEGYETVVKIFPNPLRALDFKETTSVTLTGVRQKKGLEVRLRSVSADGSARLADVTAAKP